jgi:hypothetical protein
MAVRWEAMDEDAFRNLMAAGGQAGAGVDDAEAGAAETGEETAGWDALMAELDAGLVVRVPATSDQEIRRVRTRLEQRADRRGFGLEFRYGDGFVAARKAEVAAASGSLPASTGTTGPSEAPAGSSAAPVGVNPPASPAA